MDTDTADGRRRELADFLRTRRERLRPEIVGLKTIGRRRTPGLRREEVAERAGISCEWYLRIEQGRAVAPSQATIDAVSRALLLDPTEHGHLTRLARGDAMAPFAIEKVSRELADFVAALPQPAYLVGRRWDVLAWSAGAAALFDFARWPPGRRNILLFMMTGPAARKLFGSRWADEAVRMVALFRADHVPWAGDPAFVDLLADVRAGCPEFARWWSAHRVRRPTTGRKVLKVPRGGLRTFAYATFQANDDPALRLALYTPAT